MAQRFDTYTNKGVTRPVFGKSSKISSLLSRFESADKLPPKEKLNRHPSFSSAENKSKRKSLTLSQWNENASIQLLAKEFEPEEPPRPTIGDLPKKNSFCEVSKDAQSTGVVNDRKKAFLSTHRPDQDLSKPATPEKHLKGNQVRQLIANIEQGHTNTSNSPPKLSKSRSRRVKRMSRINSPVGTPIVEKMESNESSPTDNNEHTSTSRLTRSPSIGSQRVLSDKNEIDEDSQKLSETIPIIIQEEESIPLKVDENIEEKEEEPVIENTKEEVDIEDIPVVIESENKQVHDNIDDKEINIEPETKEEDEEIEDKESSEEIIEEKDIELNEEPDKEEIDINDENEIDELPITEKQQGLLELHGDEDVNELLDSLEGVPKEKKPPVDTVNYGEYIQLLKSDIPEIPPELELMNQGIDDEDLEVLLDLLESTGKIKFIKKIILNGNDFEVIGATRLAGIIKKNYEIEYIDISWNLVGIDGGKVLGEALTHNTNLVSILFIRLMIF